MMMPMTIVLHSGTAPTLRENYCSVNFVAEPREPSVGNAFDGESSAHQPGALCRTLQARQEIIEAAIRFPGVSFVNVPSAFFSTRLWGVLSLGTMAGSWRLRRWGPISACGFAAGE